MAPSDPLAVSTRETAAIDGQKPGTSGLRKKTRTFMEVSSPLAFRPRLILLPRGPRGSLVGLAPLFSFPSHSGCRVRPWPRSRSIVSSAAASAVRSSLAATRFTIRMATCARNLGRGTLGAEGKPRIVRMPALQRGCLRFCGCLLDAAPPWKGPALPDRPALQSTWSRQSNCKPCEVGQGNYLANFVQATFDALAEQGKVPPSSYLCPSLFGLTNLVSPGSFPLQSRRICTAHPACQLENSRSTRVRQS
jgi:hypothetical protein